MGKLPGASVGKPELRFILQPAIASFLHCVPASTTRDRAACLYVGRDHKFAAPLAINSWRVEGHAHPFLVAATLDAIYQLIIHKFIFPLELLFTATAAGARAVLHSARPSESRCMAIYQSRPRSGFTRQRRQAIARHVFAESFSALRSGVEPGSTLRARYKRTSVFEVSNRRCGTSRSPPGCFSGPRHCEFSSRACAMSQPMISALSVTEPPLPERPSCPESISVLRNRSCTSVLLARSQRPIWRARHSSLGYRRTRR